MDSKKLRRTGYLATGAASICLMALPGPAGAGPKHPLCTHPNARPSGWNTAHGFNPWGGTVRSQCNRIHPFSDIGRKVG
jgi:hypothetical protein